MPEYMFNVAALWHPNPPYRARQVAVFGRTAFPLFARWLPFGPVRCLVLLKVCGAQALCALCRTSMWRKVHRWNRTVAGVWVGGAPCGRSELGVFMQAR